MNKNLAAIIIWIIFIAFVAIVTDVYYGSGMAQIMVIFLVIMGVFVFTIDFALQIAKRQKKF